jgi:hypothetical protein
MTITCLVGLGPGQGFEEGTTVDGLGFTKPTGGQTLFHIN